MSGWVAFGCSLFLWILFKPVSAAVINRQSALMRSQGRTIEKQQEDLDRIANAWNVVFQSKKLKLGIELMAKNKVRLVAQHDDPVQQAEGQAELDRLQRLIREAKTGKEDLGSMN
jgi:hypothetical protein